MHLVYARTLMRYLRCGPPAAPWRRTRPTRGFPFGSSERKRARFRVELGRLQRNLCNEGVRQLRRKCNLRTLGISEEAVGEVKRIAGVCGLLALVFAAASCGSGSPGYGHLIFISRKTGDYVIRLPQPGNVPAQELANDFPWDAQPVYSPDGSRIAFYSDRVFDLTNADDNVDIYVMNADGSDMTRLTTGKEPDAFPVWSPDGKRIAFYSERDGNGEIYSMDPDGSNVIRLTNSPGVDIPYGYSPDGSKILFGSNRNGNFDIWVMNADGSNQKALISSQADAFRGVWSPDGKRIAYQSTEFNSVDIFVMNADGSDTVNMTVRPLSDDSPAWAPDGVRIAFVSHRDADAEIYVLGTQFSDLTRVTTAPRNDVTPAWSPDGTRIAFVSNRDFNPEIYVANADGTGQKRLTNDPGWDANPEWSPDGKVIAFESTRNGRRDIFTIKPDGTGLVRLTTDIAPVPVSASATQSVVATPVGTDNGLCTANASMSIPAPPSPHYTQTVTGVLTCTNGIAPTGAIMHAVWHEKAADKTCDATADATGTASCSRQIGALTSGYKVSIDVTFGLNGAAYATTTSFTPQ
jgi:Tol biopolymer transport system component